MQHKLLERAKQRYEPSIRMWLCLLVVSLLPLLCACSTTLFRAPRPELEASLALDCPPLPPAPKPLLDPDRIAWEVMLSALYGDCASRHHHTVAAWPRDKTK